VKAPAKKIPRLYHGDLTGFAGSTPMPFTLFEGWSQTRAGLTASKRAAVGCEDWRMDGRCGVEALLLAADAKILSS